MRETLSEYSLRTGDVAHLLGVSQATVSRWADTGILHCWRVPVRNGARCFRPEDVQAFIDAHLPEDGAA